MVLIGAAAGAQFPVLVAHLTRGGGGVGSPAGRIYAFDLVGAVFGATLTGVVLTPIVGIGGTMLIAATLKIGSVILILTGRRWAPTAP
jgi:uncharacterized membrane protein YuzA (DUF378 family)